MRALPDVSSEIYAYGASLHAVMDELEYLFFCIHFWSACYHYRNRASIYYLIEILAPVSFHNFCPNLGGNPAAEAEVAGVAFFKFPSYGCHCHNRDTVLFCLIHKLSGVKQCLTFILAADKDRHTNRGH